MRQSPKPCNRTWGLSLHGYCIVLISSHPPSCPAAVSVSPGAGTAFCHFCQHGHGIPAPCLSFVEREIAMGHSSGPCTSCPFTPSEEPEQHPPYHHFDLTFPSAPKCNSGQQQTAGSQCQHQHQHQHRRRHKHKHKHSAITSLLPSPAKPAPPS